MTTTANETGHVGAIRRLGTMLVKGEGGEMRMEAGKALWQVAATEGDEKAYENRQALQRLLKRAEFW